VYWRSSSKDKFTFINGNPVAGAWHWCDDGDFGSSNRNSTESSSVVGHS
jgi:hypothetical protein